MGTALRRNMGAERGGRFVSSWKGNALGVLTADCCPVLLADIEAENMHGAVVGAAHAGWRGALGGILEATIAAMEKDGAKAGRMTAALGPTIAQESYEVGEEFSR